MSFNGFCVRVNNPVFFYIVFLIECFFSYIVFINDGGCKAGIKRFIVETSNKPIFWQFVGIGDSNFDVLRKLDTMEGRFIDNANFFHLDNLETVSDAQLYDQLLDEFPKWLQEAKDKHVL